MRIAVDVMGGDHAPDAILEGSLDALPLIEPDDRLVLLGDESVIGRGIEKRGLTGDPRLEIIATSQIIEMDETPVMAVRNKPDSSLVRMAQLAGRRGNVPTCDIVLSAGNTGAFVAAAMMTVRRLPGVYRPGIAVTLPTFAGPVILCDVGANPEPKPGHLYQYAHMANVYAQRVTGIREPKVALMSIGAEETKGNQLVKDANKLLRTDRTLNYVGYCEGRELFDGKANVVVCEGFTGNVVLKLAEGLSAGLFQTIHREIAETDPDLAPKFTPIVKSIYRKHDYHEYGGAPLLGVNGICVICHGSSVARTIKAAIRNSIEFSRHDVNAGIVEAIAGLDPMEEGAA
ncbi:MAG: phosphate acyltransferase PlsX [Phycisphaeraceae bacterium]|nr:phosphate acyltransferase PlsX [Phycisphaeraceae bacterium]